FSGRCGRGRTLQAPSSGLGSPKKERQLDELSRAARQGDRHCHCGNRGQSDLPVDSGESNEHWKVPEVERIGDPSEKDQRPNAEPPCHYRLSSHGADDENSRDKRKGCGKELG